MFWERSFAVADASQSHAACACQAHWPQDVANMHTKLKSLSFSRVSVGMLGTFFGFLCYVFRTTLVVFCCCECVTKLCSLCLAGSLAARCGKHAKKLKRLSFISLSWVSEGALDTFLRSLCYVLGTKLGGILLLRMHHKAMQLVLGRPAGYKMC